MIMPSNSTRDCITTTRAASSQPAGSASATGSTTNELRVASVNASVRPAGADNPTTAVLTFASSNAPTRNAVTTASTTGRKVRACQAVSALEAATAKITAASSGTGA